MTAAATVTRTALTARIARAVRTAPAVRTARAARTARTVRRTARAARTARTARTAHTARTALGAGSLLVTCVLLAGCAAPEPVSDATPGEALSKVYAEGERPTAPDLTGKSLEGDGIRLSDHRGKVVLLNAWASWCGPCRAEAPELKKIQEKWGGRGVDVLGIDNDHSRADALAFQKEFRLSYPSLHDPAKRQILRLPRGLVNAQSLPFTILIDRTGKVAAARMGMVTEEEMAGLITPLLPKTASGSAEPEG
ncbi:TlpA family protein disulfide reductase [Streptomyces sp. NPDC012623]|uniref:TlpA family protein disulfide reductase n=1 Tax=unclassified Streptomyces TaxID=2593676 RepID=UPI003680ED50